MRSFRSQILIVVLLAITAANAAAQYDTGAVLGTVMDSSGAVVPGAKLSLKSVSTGVAAERVSNQSGEYEFTGVLPGDYVLTSVAAGFKTEATTFSVTVDARQRV